MAVSVRVPEGVRIDYKQLPTKEIYVDRAIQRALSEIWVDYLIRNWWQPAAGTLIVSQRERDQNRPYVVISGQHRLMAMKSLGIERAWCEIVHGLSPEQEARVFVETAAVRGTHPLDLFRLRLKSGDSSAQEIIKVLHSFKVDVNWGGKTGPGYSCMASLQRLYDHGVLWPVIEIIENCWPTQPQARSAIVVEGLAQFHMSYDGRNAMAGKYEMDKLLERLPRMPLQGMLMNARTIATGRRRSVAYAFAEEVAEAYNRSAKQRLGSFRPTRWTLRWKNVPAAHHDAS